MHGWTGARWRRERAMEIVLCRTLRHTGLHLGLWGLSHAAWTGPAAPEHARASISAPGRRVHRAPSFRCTRATLLQQTHTHGPSPPACLPPAAAAMLPCCHAAQRKRARRLGTCPPTARQVRAAHSPVARRPPTDVSGRGGRAAVMAASADRRRGAFAGDTTRSTPCPRCPRPGGNEAARH
jgi:hypothetical protein